MAPERVLRSTIHANAIVRCDESRRVLSCRTTRPVSAPPEHSYVAEAKAGSSLAPRRMRSSAGTTAGDQTQPREVALGLLLDYAAYSSSLVETAPVRDNAAVSPSIGFGCYSSAAAGSLAGANPSNSP